MKAKKINLEQYVELREKIRDSNYLVWENLNEKILELIETTENLTPEIVEDIKKAYDDLVQGIIPSVLPVDFIKPKTFQELEMHEITLVENIPEAIRKMFNKLFKAYLKNSTNNPLLPDETLYNLLTKFNNENVELRYPNNSSNPYQNQAYRRARQQGYNWKSKAADELYSYFDGLLTMLSNIRNFQTHKEDAFTSTQFELAGRKVSDPLSGISNPGNYIVLVNIVILSTYQFIEILQTWVDTQARIGNTG